MTNSTPNESLGGPVLAASDLKVDPPQAPLIELIVTEPLVAPALNRLAGLVDDAVDLRPRRLVIDLARCALIDAATIDLLLDAHRRVWRSGGRLTLRGPSPRLRTLLELARVDEVFHIVPSAEPAAAVP